MEVARNVLVKDKVGYRLENGEPFVVTWHVANVTNLIISTESLTGANIEVRHAKNESSMIMDRCGIQTSVILHKFAKVRLVEVASRQQCYGQRSEDCGCRHETYGHRGDGIR